MNLVEKYNVHIHERFRDLKNSQKTEFDNYDLAKIFEYYTSIKLFEETGQLFYEYNDIDPNYKEEKCMSKNDTGIDLCDLSSTIVQCKLRKDVLTWTEMSTFFASNITKGLSFKWPNYIVARNDDCQLSRNLKCIDWYTDKTYNKGEMIKYCEELLENPPEVVVNEQKSIELRDYQIECLDLIHNSGNLVCCLPTGTGKNLIIIKSLDLESQYLILVPRIILMDQLKSEILKHTKIKASNIQLIGDGHNKNLFDKNKCVTICVYNSIGLIYEHCEMFDKIFVDEAHHINVPEIYENEEENEDVEKSENVVENDVKNEDVENDEENETNEVKNSYITKISSLSRFNNNVYLSATIDEIEGFKFYKKDIREMIQSGYLCDYTIHVPIFSDNASNKSICEYLLQNYRNIIIYCNTQEEGKEINKILNSLQLNSSRYIDSNTSKNQRDKILQDYKLGFTPFLVNIKVLVEGFDSQKTKGVCLLHMPSSQTSLVQILGRALRLHPTKTYANIILPFSVDADGKHINKFLKVMANNDSRIMTSYINKKLGGYININHTDEQNNDGYFKYEMVYNSLGNQIYNEEIWLLKFEEAKKMIDILGRLPKVGNGYPEKYTILWINRHNSQFINKTKIMTNHKIYDIWDNFVNFSKYSVFFIKDIDVWRQHKNCLKLFIIQHNKLPSQYSKDPEEIKLRSWVRTQKYNAKHKIGVMKNDIIYKEWIDFVEQNKNHIKYNDYVETWMNNFTNYKQYILEFNSLPSYSDSNKLYKTLANWADRQQDGKFGGHEKLKIIWNEYINREDIKILFLGTVDQWKNTLKYLYDYYEKNKKFPAYSTFEMKWYRKNKFEYENDIGMVVEIEEYKNLWKTFINDENINHPTIKGKNYEKYWFDKLNTILIYVNSNKKLPIHNKSSTKQEISDDRWLHRQNIHYKENTKMMRIKNIRNTWIEFVNKLKENNVQNIDYLSV